MRDSLEPDKYLQRALLSLMLKVTVDNVEAVKVFVITPIEVPRMPTVRMKQREKCRSKESLLR